MYTKELSFNKLKTQHYGIKHSTSRYSSLNVYRQSVCTIFRSNLDTRWYTDWLVYQEGDYDEQCRYG